MVAVGSAPGVEGEGLVAVDSAPPGTAAVRVIATAVPTCSGEKGGVAVPPVGGTGTGTGMGKSQARVTIPRIRNARKGRKRLFIIYLVK